jgi:Xaa-Pro aminopeptidase
VYFSLLDRFRRHYELPFGIAPYFTNLYAGRRTDRPALPVDAEIQVGDVVKLDAGVLVHTDGLLLASSDVARSYSGAGPAQGAPYLFSEVIRDEVLPAMRPGQRGGAVHALVTQSLERRSEALEAMHLLPELDWRPTRDFQRDVGHLMSKQESVVSSFLPGAEMQLHDGAVIAVEIQWAWDELALASEDMAFVRSDRAVALST